MNTSIRRFLKEEDGITALEYGILAAIVAAAIVLVFKARLGSFFGQIFDALDSAAGTSTGSG
jgi:pilus assembly protein Flp/PilA